MQNVNKIKHYVKFKNKFTKHLDPFFLTQNIYYKLLAFGLKINIIFLKLCKFENILAMQIRNLNY